jgi:hypothetical protein
MRKLIAILVLLITVSVPVYAEDMQKYLSETEALVREGKHKAALDRFLWFHDHALEHDPAMYGVRLSFALSDWKQLGDVYPPALTAMKKIRDDKVNLLIQGKGNSSLFHDVESLNSKLGDNAKTVELFRTLDEGQKDLAKQCWDMAKTTIIKDRAYDLVRKYIGNPVREWGKVKQMYEMNKAMYRGKNFGEHFKAYNENNLVEESLKLIEVALALDDKKAANEIQAKALVVVDDYRLRDAIPKNQTEDAQQKNSCDKK